MRKKKVSLNEFRKMAIDEQKKNFSFLSDEDRGTWRLTCPIYPKDAGSTHLTSQERKEGEKTLAAIVKGMEKGISGLDTLNELGRKN